MARLQVPFGLLVVASLVLLILLELHLDQPSNCQSSSSYSYPSHPKRGQRSSGRRTIYIVTPTYPRSDQIPSLTQLAQTLLLVDDVFWVVAEDTHEDNPLLLNYLLSTGLPFVHLKTPMPSQMRRWRLPPKGVPNRRAALAWIRRNARTGVVYFADDDNTYDYRLFEEIRDTRGVSMFPAGFVTRLQLSTPVVRDGRFVDWYDGWIIDRRFPVDMATFAFSVELLLKKPRANMAWSYSYQEESILASLGVQPHEIEFKAENCTKIWVWHTKSVRPELADRDIFDPKYDDTNLRILQEQMYIKRDPKSPAHKKEIHVEEKEKEAEEDMSGEDFEVLFDSDDNAPDYEN